MNDKSKLVHTILISGIVIIKKGAIVEARLQEAFDDANSQAYPRPTQEIICRVVLSY